MGFLSFLNNDFNIHAEFVLKIAVISEESAKYYTLKV